MKKIIAIIIVLILSFFGFNVDKWVDEIDPVTTTQNMQEEYVIPSVDEFSSEKLQDFEYQFSPIKEARIYVDGVETKLKKDDPKLIRLLNFCAYSKNIGSGHISQGEVTNGDEAREYKTRLEILFDIPEQPKSIFSRVDFALIVGDTIWLVETNPNHSALHGNMSTTSFSPYADQRRSYDIELDILHYCGLINVSSGEGNFSSFTLSKFNDFNNTGDMNY